MRLPGGQMLQSIKSAIAAIGRVVRTAGHDDDTRAYVLMPSFETFEVFTRRVENDMSLAPRVPSGEPKSKRCPACARECALGERSCAECGHEFPVGPQRLKPCGGCGALNPVTATACHACGDSFAQNFTLTLDEALRAGAIVRGMDIDENEVLVAEEIAPAVRNLILRSGDSKLVKILQTLPDESWARLRKILVAQ